MANRMNQQRREAANAAQLERLSAERAKGSTAERYTISAKRAETLIRDYWYVGGIRAESDFRARKAGACDMRLFGRHTEIKCGGTLAYDFPSDWDQDDLMPGAAWILFPLIDRCEEEDDLPDMTPVMTRQEFFEILDGLAPRKGWRATVKVNRGNRAETIGFQPKYLDKLRDRLEDAINTGELPTLRTLYEEAREGGA